MRETSPTAVALTSLPAWGPTLLAAREAFEQLAWPYRAFAAWPCPVLRVASGSQSGAALQHEINRHRRVRDYANRLAREPGYVFEVREDGAELDAWCEEFCDTHEWRWNTTSTPSSYRSPEARALFRDVLAGWGRDHVLVRFAIRLRAGRVAFVAALRAGTRLVYHHVSTSPAAENLRAGHALIRLIGLWMSERGFDTLDLGAGGEAYKMRYANGNEPLWRLYAARRRLSLGYARGLAEERIRRSSAMQRAWDRWVNARLRVALDVCWRGLARWKSLVRRLRHVAATRHEICYRAYGLADTSDASDEVTDVRTFAVLSMLEQKGRLSARERAALYARRASGARLLGIVEDGKVLHAALLAPMQRDGVPDWVHPGARALWRVTNLCSAGGTESHLLHRDVLRGVLGRLEPDELAIVCAETSNGQAKREILAAGFEVIARRRTQRGREIFERV